MSWVLVLFMLGPSMSGGTSVDMASMEACVAAATHFTDRYRDQTIFVAAYCVEQATGDVLPPVRN